MFYCDRCGNDRGWPTGHWWPRSRGACEICNGFFDCMDIPSKNLPLPKRKDEPTEAEIEAAIKSIGEAQ